MNHRQVTAIKVTIAHKRVHGGFSGNVLSKQPTILLMSTIIFQCSFRSRTLRLDHAITLCVSLCLTSDFICRQCS